MENKQQNKLVGIEQVTNLIQNLYKKLIKIEITQNQHKKDYIKYYDWLELLKYIEAEKYSNLHLNNHNLLALLSCLSTTYNLEIDSNFFENIINYDFSNIFDNTTSIKRIYTILNNKLNHNLKTPSQKNLEKNLIILFFRLLEEKINSATKLEDKHNLIKAKYTISFLLPHIENNLIKTQFRLEENINELVKKIRENTEIEQNKYYFVNHLLSDCLEALSHLNKNNKTALEIIKTTIESALLMLDDYAFMNNIINSQNCLYLEEETQKILQEVLQNVNNFTYKSKTYKKV